MLSPSRLADAITCILLASTTSLIAGTNPANIGIPQTVRTISFHEFRQLVLHGKEVSGRIVPAKYIVCVLQDSEILQTQSPRASLKLKSSRVIGAKIRINKPTRPIDRLPAAVREHLTSRDKTRTEAVYVGLPIVISDTVFDAEVYLNDVILEKDIFLENVQFNESVYFQGTVFETLAILKHVRFGSISDFSGSLFLDSITFRDCEFKLQANFANSTVTEEGKVFISGQSVSVPLDFSGSALRGILSLEGLEQTLQMRANVYLNGVNSGRDFPTGELRLKDIELQDGLYLDRGKWARLDLAESKDGRHRPIRFRGFCDIRQGVLGVVDLAGAEFDRGADFTNTEFKSAINFERTRIREPIRIRWKQIEAKLRSLDEPKSANKQQRYVKLSAQGYEELERNFKQLGDLEGENECRFEKRFIHKGKGIEWVGSVFEWIISGYWVRPLRPLLYMGISFLLFLAINSRGFRRNWFRADFPRKTGLDFVPEPWRLTILVAAFRPLLPEGYSGILAGRMCYLSQYIWMKSLQIVFLVTLSHTSPLLKEFLPYLKPG